MFATLRYSQGNKPIRVERQQFADELTLGRGPHHVACENCRVKKVVPLIYHRAYELH